MARLAPRHPCLPPYTPRTYRVSVPQASLEPLSLVRLMMVYPFLALATAWHMMHAKSNAMQMTQWVALFPNWLRAAKIEPLQGIAALISVDLADATLAQQKGIRTSLAPPPPFHSPQASISHYSSPSSCKRRPHHQLPRGKRGRQQSGGGRIYGA